MDRRTFLGTLTAATLLSKSFSLAAEQHKIEKVGLQLYTVRGQMKKDFEGTLSKVASIGYREVEFAGLFGHPAKAVRAMLDHYGLTAVSGHYDFKDVTSNFNKALDDAKTLGQSFVVCPFLDEDMRTPDGIKRATETFNRAGEQSQKVGIQFAYHNHDFEFKQLGGKTIYDTLLEQTDPQLVKMEMDLFWTVNGGQDPLKYFARYPGRFPLVHVKDRKQTGEMTEVGSGVIDFKRIFADSQAGIQHYIVEHDQPKSPFDSIKQSYQYLANLSF
jgi:sugar phosphate isomerase/epimerase